MTDNSTAKNNTSNLKSPLIINSNQGVPTTMSLNIGSQPELKEVTLKSEEKAFVVNFRAAVNYTDKKTKQEVVKWFNVEAWDDLAIELSENVGIGDFVKMSCTSKPKDWIDKDGVQHLESVLRVNRFRVISRRRSSN